MATVAFLCLWVFPPSCVLDVEHQATGLAVTLAVRAGATPSWVERVFGPAECEASFRSGPLDCPCDSPVTWYYPRYGVSVDFSPTLFPVGRVIRVRGGIK
jgi:hypothetical protein